MQNELIQVFFDPSTENIDWERRQHRTIPVNKNENIQKKKRKNNNVKTIHVNKAPKITEINKHVLTQSEIIRSTKKYEREPERRIQVQVIRKSIRCPCCSRPLNKNNYVSHLKSHSDMLCHLSIPCSKFIKKGKSLGNQDFRH